MATNEPIPRHSPPAGPPRVVAVSGILFAALFITTVVLFRLAMAADPAEPGEWLLDEKVRNSIRLALNLVPFTGIAFLWYMGVLRNRLGEREDRFFATVFLGSGLLFVGLLFANAALAGAMMEVLPAQGRRPQGSETYAVGRRLAFALMNTYALKMAAVFMFVTSTIGLRTGVFPRWVAVLGFGCGLVLLLALTDFAWIALLFPTWVLLVSSWILIADFRGPSRLA